MKIIKTVRIANVSKSILILPYGTVLFRGSVQFMSIGEPAVVAEMRMDEKREIIVSFMVMLEGEVVPSGPPWFYLGTASGMETRIKPLTAREPCWARGPVSMHVYVFIPTNPDELDALFVK
jgi:hypothetical protein